MQYAKSKAIDVKTEVFYCAESLYKELKKGYEIDLLFLDIMIGKSSGVDIGLAIRNEFQKDTMQIVFISSHKEYAMELFEIRPMDFLIKPIGANKIKQVIDSIVRISNNCKNIFYFRSEGAKHKIMISEILYFKRSGRTIELITAEKSYNIYDSLEKLYHELHHFNFFYCHQSYLINYYHIKEIYYDQFIMTNHANIPISQKKRKEVSLFIKERKKEGY